MSIERSGCLCEVSRRRAMLGLLGVAGLLCAEAVGAVETEPIVQPAAPNHEAFMQYAVEIRRLATERGDQAFGAIIVRDNRVIGLGPSRVIVNRDPTAHAEIEAIRDACKRLGSPDLSGCVMYSTSKPCRMCETAAYWARVARMYYGASIADGGAPQYGSC